VTSPIRFRFADFVISPRQRLLFRQGQPVPLIPKYFDLLHLLILRRQDAVAKDVIFAEVWSDVVVTDGALSQAVRTLRRTLADDVREPKFIRTVSRHGYQFVWPDVIEEADDGRGAHAVRGSDTASAENGVNLEALTSARAAATPVTSRDRTPGPDSPPAAVEPLVDRLLSATSAEDARDIAEQLHTLGTADALATITAHPHHAPAVAMMRDARYSVPGAGEVPLLRDPEGASAIVALVRLRLADVRRVVALRWAQAAGGGALGGAAAGLIGGLALALAPGSTARPQSSVALAAIGAVAGIVGAGGVAAGLVAAEVLARSRRALGLIVCGALAGGLIASIAAILLRILLDSLFGLRLAHHGGAVDGLVLGAAAGLGYALTTSHADGGMAAPRGVRRLTVVLTVAACCGIGAIGLALLGRPLVGGLVNDIASVSRNAELALSPLGRLIGESEFGLRTRLLLSAFEGAAFGASLAWGMTRRP
jgi:DNA-binding winged helix-turn-helix (wHTH) protein